MRGKRLNGKTMVDVVDTITAIRDHILEKFDVAPEIGLEVRSWLSQIELINLHHIFRPDELNELEATIFDNENVRSFVLEVQFRFFALAGTGPGFLEGLSENLADAFTIDGPVSDWSYLPDSWKLNGPLNFLSGARLSKYWLVRLWQSLPMFRGVSVAEFLRNNPILMTFVLLRLALPVEAMDAKPQES
jgi:hypothetical protein